MAALARLQASSCATPLLDLFTQVSGVLTDVEEVSFQIYDKTTGVGVQVYPALLGSKTPVDVDTDCPGGDRLSAGHYVARWTVPSNENLGTHYIKWYFKLNGSSPEQTFIEEFEVLAEVVGMADPRASYCLIQDLRDEGVASSYSDSFLANRIKLASRQIDKWTGRHFYPKAQTLKVDGRGGPMVLLGVPIIAVSSVLFDTTPYSPSTTPIEMDLIRVYNRHLTQELLDPDDRDNPKIELFQPAESLTHYSRAYSWGRLVFPDGQQNVTIEGIFGYTDPNGTSTGETPLLIKQACMLLVVRSLEKLGSGARNPGLASRITSERTRDQAVTYAPLTNAEKGAFSGDAEIDGILCQFLRPPHLGAA